MSDAERGVEESLDPAALAKLLSETNQPDGRGEERKKTKTAAKTVEITGARYEKNENDFVQINQDVEATMSEEVRQAEMESRLRRMITEVLKPSIVKVTRLQTDHEMMCEKFQEMIDSHQQVLSAQKEAKEHSEVIGVFKSKLSEFWTFSNQLEDKINAYQKTAVQRMEELEQQCEHNKSSGLRLGRNLDRSLQDMDRINANIKQMQSQLEKGIQKNKERLDTEIRQMHILVGEVREMHNKLEQEIWGPEDCSDISPPCLRKLDMQMRKQTSLLGEAMDDISALQRLDGELAEVAQRQNASESQIKDLQNTTGHLGERVESCAQEAKADFKQASNLMAAFSANLVREARHSFKDELKHAQQMQKEVDDFVRQTQTTIMESDEFVKSLSKQLEAMVREVRFDLDSYDQKRARDKQGLEEQMRELLAKVIDSGESSNFLLKGLEHMSGVISMSLQSERMSVALDLQDFVERRETPYVGVRESAVENARLRQMRAEKGIRQPGVDIEKLHRIAYRPSAITYQGTSFDRQQLLALREKLVHVAQEVLQKGPEISRKVDTSPEGIMARLSTAATSARSGSADQMQTRSSTPARPGSRNQPAARGSPGLDVRLDRISPELETRSSQAATDAEVRKLQESLSRPPIPASARKSPDSSDDGAEGFQLPSVLPPVKRDSNRSNVDNLSAPLTAR